MGAAAAPPDGPLKTGHQKKTPRLFRMYGGRLKQAGKAKGEGGYCVRCAPQGEASISKGNKAPKIVAFSILLDGHYSWAYVKWTTSKTNLQDLDTPLVRPNNGEHF
jgi:hypothetical protein